MWHFIPNNMAILSQLLDSHSGKYAKESDGVFLASGNRVEKIQFKHKEMCCVD